VRGSHAPLPPSAAPAGKQMKRQEFEKLVDRALDGLPDEFSSLLENVVVFIADHPSRDALREMQVPQGETIFGLYEGIPLPSVHTTTAS